MPGVKRADRVERGFYVWTREGPPDDSFTLDISVPEPGSLVLIGLGAAGWSRRRA
ncbi:MAG: PEP-CTERM sorting domain-containing protein [Acetobacteraceae bacterium]